jgi:hypothetical protein
MTSPALCWARAFSPPGFFTQVPATAVQAQFRVQFVRWGLPAWIRVDNGYPWGNWNDLPTALPLWLVGMDVGVHWNEPGHPEQNPKVERSQGTGSRWAEPWTCRSVDQLQQRFEQEDRIQRELYRAVGGHSRLAAHPDLRHSGRRYSQTWERRHWDLERALQHLAQYQAVRRVSRSGHVRIYAHNYYVGTNYAGASVYVQLDPDIRAWVIADQAGTQIRQLPAQQLTRPRLMALELSD